MRNTFKKLLGGRKAAPEAKKAGRERNDRPSERWGGDVPGADALYEAFCAWMAFYCAADDDRAAREMFYPGAILPEMLPALWSGLAREVIPDAIVRACQKVAAAADPQTALPEALGMVTDACAERLEEMLAAAEEDPRQAAPLRAFMVAVNEAEPVSGLGPGRFGHDDVRLLATLCRADPVLRPMIEAVGAEISPDIIDARDNGGDDYLRFDQALITVHNTYNKLDAKAAAGEVPDGAVPLLFLTLMHRRVVLPGQMILVLWSNVLQRNAELFEGTELRQVVEALLMKMRDYAMRISAMLMSELRDGVRRADYDTFLLCATQFRDLHHGMNDELGYEGHPRHGQRLDMFRRMVIDAMLEKLMPAIGTLVFDLYPDPLAGAPPAPGRKLRQSTTGLRPEEKIPADGNTEREVLLPFLSRLREVLRDLGMDKPARDVEKGVVTGLRYRLKAYVANVKEVLEDSEGPDFGDVSESLEAMELLRDGLNTLGFEGEGKAAYSLIRTATKLGGRAGVNLVDQVAAGTTPLEGLLGTRLERLVRLLDRLAEEQRIDSTENSRFRDMGMDEVLDAAATALRGLIPVLGRELEAALSAGDRDREAALLTALGQVGDVYAAVDSPLADTLAARVCEPALAAVLGAVDGLLDTVSAETDMAAMKRRLLLAAETVQRLHAYLTARGETQAAAGLLGKLQGVLVRLAGGSAARAET